VRKTLSYGLRYSLFRRPTGANGNLTNFDPRKPSAWRMLRRLIPKAFWGQCQTSA
jgi:hypothetical protein